MTFFKSLSFPKYICYYPKNILVVESVLHEIIMAEFFTQKVVSGTKQI